MSSLSKLSIVLFCTVLHFKTVAQTNELPDPTPSFMAILVTQMDSSVAWYNHTLGFETFDQMNLEDRGIRIVNMKRGATHLELIQLNGTLNP